MAGIPPAGEWLWETFWQISLRRQRDSGYPLPLAASEFLAWSTLSREVIEPWEFDALGAMDAAFVGARCEAISKERRNA